MKNNLSKYCIVCFVLSCLIIRMENAHAGKLGNIRKLIGNQDAILVAAPDGRVLLSKNAGKKLIPASILKIFTSLMSLHYLSPDFRFTTEFYMDKNSNLKIKGYGDPLLISEVVSEIARTLHTKIDGFRDIVLDSSYFDPILIPGVTTTLNPYDAPNGALCVNFNTVYFKRKKGAYISAEAQTPLLPFALKKIRKSKLSRGRIIFSQEQDETTLYAGHLFHHFLEKEGLRSDGRIRLGLVEKESDRLVFRHVSKFSMEEVISKLLEYSNNFIANQVFAVSGIKAYGPPGTLEKGVRAAGAYAKKILKLEDIRISEGSGISRENRITAENMHKLLETFEPYRHLMRHKGREFYKTGSLSGVKTRAGYIENENGELYRFTVMINTPGKSTKNIMSRLLNALP